jgi:hypothetical protein
MKSYIIAFGVEENSGMHPISRDPPMQPRQVIEIHGLD